MRTWACILCVGVTLQAADPDARELFERARMLAEQNQQLDQAIRLYAQAVQFAGTDKALGGQAQYRQGLLYERLGRKADAVRAFEAVLQKFGQTEVARLARARLPNRDAAVGMRTRQAWAGDDVDSYGAPSPDGRLLSFTDWVTGDLAVRDLTTGEVRHVTQKNRTFAESPETAMWSVFSPDGAQLGYDWYLEDGTAELRVVSVAGTQPRTLYKGSVRGSVHVMNWSPDGRFLLAETWDKAEPAPFVRLITVSDGTSRVLATPDCICQRMLFSRDSRFIAYDARAAGEERTDIYVASVYGDRVEKAVSAAESDDSLIGWTPDGTGLMFASDRSGSKGIWVLAVTDGVAAGAPRLLRGGVDTGTPLGITKAGSLYYAVPAGTNQREVFVAGIDLVSHRITEPPRAVSPRYAGNKATPAWSPDGKRLAYLVDSFTRLVILSLEDGSEREVTPKLVFTTRILSWHPDGRAVLVQGLGGNNQSGTWKLDIETGDATFLVGVNDRPAFSPDMRTAYHGNGSVTNAGIYAQDLLTGELKKL